MNIWVPGQDWPNSGLQVLGASVLHIQGWDPATYSPGLPPRLNHVGAFYLLQSASQVLVISIRLYSPRKWPLPLNPIIKSKLFQRAVIF